MINYEICWENRKGRPAVNFNDPALWWLSELNSCNPDYILDEVMPNLEKIWIGEKVPDISIKHHTIKLIDTYEFGYDATLLDFGIKTTVISYGYGDGSIEVPSSEIYQFMKEWAEQLEKWRSLNNNTK